MIDYTKGIAKAMQRTKERLMSDLVQQVFAQTYSAYKDTAIMEEMNSTIPKWLKVKEMLSQMMGQDDLPLDNIWRVQLMENHKVMLTDFTMPSSSSTLSKTIPISEAPDFIRNGLAVLQIAQDDTLVEGVGKRISDSIYYIVERNSGVNTGEES